MPEVLTMWSLLARRAGRVRALLPVVALLIANPAAAQRVWTPAITISPPAQNSRSPQLAIAENGDAVATWTREQLSAAALRLTQATRMTANGFWGPASNLYAAARRLLVPCSSTGAPPLRPGPR